MCKVILTFRLALLLLLSISLTACLGGTIAQQVLRSVATRVADSAIGNAIEKHEKEARNQPSELSAFMVNSSFRELQPTVEPLQNTSQNTSQKTTSALQNQAIFTDEAQANEALAEIKIVPLMRVEVLNLLVGDEKKAVFERARLMGALNLPKPREWPLWHVAIGMPETSNQQPISFLIPPHVGKLPSGAIVVVEMAVTGDLNMLRHQASESLPQTITQKIIQNPAEF